MSHEMSIHLDDVVAQTVSELAMRGYGRPGRPDRPSNPKYEWLTKAGSRLWLDTGDADAADPVWASELEALTTNNTLVNQVVQTGVLDQDIAEASRQIKLTRPDISDRALAIEVGFFANARLALGLVEKFGARVSVELHPDFAFDIEATLVFARRYHAINPDYFYIKVPLTPDAFVAVRRLSSEGIPVNYTLGFSARQNYLAARFSRPLFVNTFLGRLNALVETNKLGDPENVGEKATLASWELVRGLRQHGEAIPTRQIAASIRNGGQVAALAGVDVLTIPPKAAGEFLNSNTSEADLHTRSAEQTEVKLDTSAYEEFGLNTLWDVDRNFVAFTDDALANAENIRSGADLANLAETHGVSLFGAWSDKDRAAIRDGGKIPDLSRWPGAPPDDLMAAAALESFVLDQAELDERILKIASEG